MSRVNFFEEFARDRTEPVGCFSASSAGKFLWQVLELVLELRQLRRSAKEGGRTDLWKSLEEDVLELAGDGSADTSWADILEYVQCEVNFVFRGHQSSL